jgi:uncharacterized protein with FMN-binding domain
VDSTPRPPVDQSRRSTSSADGRAQGVTSAERAGSSAKKVGNGLVALGSAAVVAVYTAGFLRTRPAAARLEAASQRRFPAPVQAMVSVELPGATASAGAARTSSSAESASGGASLALPTTSRARLSEAPSAAPTPEGSSAPVTSVSAPSKGTAPGATAPLVASSAEPQPSTSASSTLTPPPPAAAPSLSGVPSGDRTVADALAALPPVVASAAHYKDGTYSGWGSCRHGDLEATVVIEGGRIVAARISQCLTRYSCSWIAPLPPQVLARQSQNVDYVSGATQSATAFYDAIGEALGKAK